MHQSYRQSADGISLSLRVQPGSSRTAWAGLYADRVKLKLSAKAVDGQANEALIDFLARYLDTPKSSITITHGLTNRDKTVFIKGNPEKIAGKLDSAIKTNADPSA